jgi:23S rRNA pseudouridine1911/1915/1917 synthase
VDNLFNNIECKPLRTGDQLTQPIISVDPSVEDLDPAVEIETREWSVDQGLHGLRLDKGMAELVPGFSRSWLQQLIADQHVSLNGRRCDKASTRLKIGDRLRAELHPPAQVSAFLPESIPLAVIHEDDHLMVVDKPAGMVVHPAAGNWTGTLLNALLAYHPAAQRLPRAGIVHRLDKDTSGLMVIGKTQEACEVLVRQIAARQVHRVYVALVHGQMACLSDQEITGWIGRDPRHRLRMAVLPEGTSGARDALTRVRLLDRAPGVTWVGCKLHTGRTHQIRVHLASIGHPLVGDGLYGGRPQWGLSRQALHAHVLAFRHPLSGEVIRLESPLPEDLCEAVVSAGLNYNLNRLWQIDIDLAAPPA